MIWKLRCIAAWGCRSIGVIVSFYLMVVLLRAYEANPRGFEEVFSLGVGEIAMVGFGAIIAFDLLGRFLSWTNPKGPLPRFRHEGQ